jgi:hypothetical protein
MTDNAAAEGIKIISPFQDANQAASTVTVSQSYQGPRHEFETGFGQVGLGQEIIPMGIEAG